MVRSTPTHMPPLVHNLQKFAQCTQLCFPAADQQHEHSTGVYTLFTPQYALRPRRACRTARGSTPLIQTHPRQTAPAERPTQLPPVCHHRGGLK